MCATEHASRRPFRLHERRHSLAEIVERGAVGSRAQDLDREECMGVNIGLYYNWSAAEEERDKLERALKETEEKMERLLDRRMQAECAAAVAEARLSDLRAWEKAVKLFSSALKDADASARGALCKDPEGEIEKLMEGQTVEKVTGEQAQEDAQQ